ncbi:uncharacterized protein LOC142182308 [Nicotiana tabacum]|uniref:Uncharacterized protein LOC142182308 n=1 Tax=Nicotiana tabacum TaxID=4097 RepID=A0AC58UT09_TOBAC
MMFKSLYWNIRSISSSGAFDRLKQIIWLQNLPFIAISEPFHKEDYLDRLRTMMGYDNAHANINSQIWIIWNNDLNYNVVEEFDQYVTCIIEWMGTNIVVTSVYAKCDAGFSGSQFTWCNGWSPNRRVWKRLDRVLVNQYWMNNYDSTNVNHLIRTRSDHSSLLTIAKNTSQHTTKYFKFLDFWTNKNGFKGVVKQAWDIEMLIPLVQDLFGNIFDNVRDLEKKVDDLEHKIITNNTDINKFELNRINVLLIKAYKSEEYIWKQKSGIKWFVEGEVNSKFFHSMVEKRGLTAIPTMEEFKVVVFSTSPSSALGPDGNQIPKAMTHTCLILIPKVDNPLSFNELRPISLDNFSCKIISSLVNQRLSPFMNKIISPYQIGFIKRRSITESIMMTQDMVHNNTKPSTHGNVVLKVDMAKAYGRHEFFNSSRGLRQGDPLSPSLFLIRAELYSRLMDSLNNHDFIPFSIDSHGLIISHLCYADDTILFFSTEPESLKIMMEKMETYEKISGQLVNKAKSSFYVNFQDDDTRINQIKQITGYNHYHFPMQYLGCPIYIGRKKVIYFNNMVANIAKRLQGWQGKFLTYGGKDVPIKSVLEAIALHTLSVVNPPKSTKGEMASDLLKIHMMPSLLRYGKNSELKNLFSKIFSKLSIVKGSIMLQEGKLNVNLILGEE